MHITEEILREYGLKWQSEEDTGDIEQLIKEKANKRGETTFLETLDYHGRFVLQDANRFIEKMGLFQSYKSLPKWFFDFIVIELFFAKSHIKLLANCMLSDTNIDNIIGKKITREENFFIDRYPEYQIKKVFNPEEAKSTVAEIMKKEWTQFYYDATHSEGMLELYWLLSVRVEREGVVK